MVEGQLQVQGEVIHVIVNQCYDFSKWLRQFTSSNNETTQVLTPANYNYLDSYQNIATGQNK
jgi:error-prone DNA polymerase